VNRIGSLLFISNMSSYAGQTGASSHLVIRK
jgi:hypothetical protein